MSIDPRTRTSRHLLTPDNLSTTIQISNLPTDWNQDVVASVITGSGPITNISTKNDPRTGKLTAVNFDYKTAKDCALAYDLVSRIVKFPCTFERIIPADYKSKIKNGGPNLILEADERPELKIGRDSFPWTYGLELPFQMVTAVPLPRRPPTNQETMGNSGTGTGTGASTSTSTPAGMTAPIPFPDILSKASQHLPQLKPNVLTTPDQVSINLSKIQPLQVIEIVSNLKILANQSLSNRPQIEKFLNTNKDISVSISQALLEMGLIDSDVVAKVLRTYRNKSQPITNSGMNSPVNRGVGMPGMDMGMPVPMGMSSIIAPMNAPARGPMGMNMNMNMNVNMGMNMGMPMGSTNAATGTGMGLPGVPMQTPNMAPQPPTQPVSSTGGAITSPSSTATSTTTATTSPKSSSSSSPSSSAGFNNAKPQIDNTKLQKLPENQQEMIRQVLQLTDDQLKQLPAEQRSMVENLRREYLL